MEEGKWGRGGSVGWRMGRGGCGGGMGCGPMLRGRMACSQCSVCTL